MSTSSNSSHQVPHLFEINTALISVSNKTNLALLAQCLAKKNIAILASDGTSANLTQCAVQHQNIAEYIEHPEILGGRVKTLHPKVHGGILARINNLQDMQDLKIHQINKINLVIVNLYPFQEQAKQQSDINKLIEYIDIGGQTLIRAAAKNYQDNVVIVDPTDYEWLINKLENSASNAIDISLTDRFNLAAKAFKHTSEYEQAISMAFNKQEQPKINLTQSLSINLNQVQTLRYGENPEQEAALYSFDNLSSTPSDVVGNTLANPTIIQGKELSYNNLVDSADALAILKSKPNIRVIKYNFNDANNCAMDNLQFKSINGGILIQTKMTTENLSSPHHFNIVTNHDKLTAQQILDLKFCWYAVQNVKSNAIVLGEQLQTIGIGGGQTSRVGSVELALHLAKKLGHQKRLANAVMASDAFFPFADGIELAAEHGIKAIIQPGGSKADDTVIAKANALGIAMVFTHKRKFYH